MYKARATVDRILILHPARQDRGEIIKAIETLYNHFHWMWIVGEEKDANLELRVKLLHRMRVVMHGEFMSGIDSGMSLTDANHDVYRGQS